MSSNSALRRLAGRWRVFASIALCIGVLWTGGVGLSILAGLKEPPRPRTPEPRVFNVEVFDAERTDLQEVLTGFGTARADREVLLAAQVPGEIVAVYERLEVGEPVRGPEIGVGPGGESVRSASTPLLRIDPADYEERIRQARNRLAEDQAELDRVAQEERNTERVLTNVRKDYETVRKEYERVQALLDRNAATPSQLSQALLELRRYEDAIVENENRKNLYPLQRKQIESRMESRRTELRIAELELERTEVRPPFSGILSEVMVEKGQFVRAGDSLVRVTDLSEVEVPVFLPLQDYAKIERRIRERGRLSGGGSPAAVPDLPRVRLAENETAEPRWTGTVVRAAPAADERTRTIQVFVRVDNTQQPDPLLPGTFVHARIDGPVLRAAVFLPRDAMLRERAFVAIDGRAEERKVTIDRTLRDLALVSAGVEPGEQVVLTNLDVLADGAAVRVQTRRTLADLLRDQPIPIARPALAGGSAEDEPSGR